MSNDKPATFKATGRLNKVTVFPDSDVDRRTVIKVERSDHVIASCSLTPDDAIEFAAAIVEHAEWIKAQAERIEVGDLVRHRNSERRLVVRAVHRNHAWVQDVRDTREVGFGPHRAKLDLLDKISDE